MADPEFVVATTPHPNAEDWVAFSTSHTEGEGTLDTHSPMCLGVRA